MIAGILPGNIKRLRWLWLAGALFLSGLLTVLAWNRQGETPTADPLTTSERAWLKTHPVIRLAPDPDFPPVEYFSEDGVYGGITADYVALIEKRLGIRIEIIRLNNWSDIIGKAKRREIDVFVAGETPQRAEYMLFTRPFLELPAVIIAREKVRGPLTLEKLSGMRISVVSEYSTHNFIAASHPELRLDPVPDVRTGLRKVSFGLSDAFVENLATASYYLEKEGISNLRIVGESGYYYRMGFCSRKDWPELNRILEKGLAGISRQEKKTIKKKWISLESPSLFMNRKFQTGILVAFSVIIAGAIGVISWNRTLARQVALRTGELENELAERRKIEEKLRFTQYAVDNSANYAFWMTEDGRLFYVNDAACRALGYSREELLQMAIPDIDPYFPPEVFAAHWTKLREQGAVTHESYHRVKDGRVYPVEIHDNLVIFDGREYNCAFMIDISERRRMQEELERARDELEKRVIERTAELARTTENLIAVEQEKNLFLNVTDALVVYFDPEMNIRWANRAACESTGMFQEELQQRRCWNVWHQRREPCVGCPVIMARDTGEAHEAEMCSPDGRVWFIRGYPVKDKTGRVTGIVEFCQDFTERKKAEEQLLLSQFCIDRAGIGIYRSDENGTIFSVNEYVCKSLGYTRDELRGLGVFDIDPEITPEIMLELKDTLDNTGSVTHYSTHRRKDGSTFPVEITANHLHFHGKQFGISFVKDITERKRAEEALRRAKEEWERTFDSVPDLIAILDNHHGIMRVNKAMAKRLGFKPEECVGLKCYEAVHGLSGPPPFCPHVLTMTDGVIHVTEVHEERLGGDFLVSAIPLNDERGEMTGSVHIAYDITERKRAEEALRESESRVRRKLESILDPDGDVGELELADILDASRIQALMDDLHRITGLNMSIIDLDGRVLIGMGWQGICSKFHRIHPETRKKCLESDTELTVGVPPGEFRAYRCKNNMCHLVTPIIIGGKHMGNLFLGQFFHENEAVDYELFRAQARQYGFPEKEYISALEAVPRHREELIDQGKNLFLRLTDMFSKLSYANIKLAHSVAERDRLTATLREANMVVENSPVVLFRCKPVPGWPVEMVSRNVMQFGYSAEDFLSGSLTFSSIIYPHDLGKIATETEEFIAAGGGRLLQEYRIITKTGDVRWIIDETNCERNGRGEISRFEGVIIDVTDRKLAEEALRKANLVVENSPVVLFRWKADDEWAVELVSSNVIQFGYTPDEFLAGVITYSAIIHPDDRERVSCEVHDFCSEPTNQFRLEYRIITKWGDVRWVNEHSNIERDDTGGVRNFEGIVIDITERKLFEQELQLQKRLLQELNDTLERRVEDEVRKSREKDIMLIQQNRQAALGEMLDHIAHQWKQPLNSISLIAQDVADSSAYGELTDEETQASIGKITSLLEHMSQTIDVFRGFYRPDKETKVFNVKESIDQALAFIAPTFRLLSITVEVDIDPGLMAFGYPKEYTQVLLNILANARDVFRLRRLEKPRLTVRAYVENMRAVVTITDNAGGISASVINRIFDVYFTTNEAGGGSGIGLYMSKNIIEKNMGGTLSAENVDDGAQFRIEIPLA